MRTLTWVGYVVLLVGAFAVGLIGTIAAGRAFLAATSSPLPAFEQPTQVPVGAPERAPVLPTVEC
jgi:hypothetical protein